MSTGSTARNTRTVPGKLSTARLQWPTRAGDAPPTPPGFDPQFPCGLRPAVPPSVFALVPWSLSEPLPPSATPLLPIAPPADSAPTTRRSDTSPQLAAQIASPAFRSAQTHPKLPREPLAASTH